MAKNIIFCFDGTWNHPVLDPRGDVLEKSTNVFKIFSILEQSPRQVVLYDNGVGADEAFAEHALAGAVGDGLFKKIKDGYTKIAHVYEKGDQIYLFGFSRGAYTARSLAGMIAECGIPLNFTGDATGRYFDIYREQRPEEAEKLKLAADGEFKTFKATIAMIGVWDTVGSLGIPKDLVPDLDKYEYGFLDTSLHPDIKAAYHALALDERRREFQPTLWREPAQAGQKLEQVWFTGVHCDVGGGYGNHQLADIPLIWMIQNAKNEGAHFENPLPMSVQKYNPACALGKKHESWSPLWLQPATRVLPPHSKISDTVQARVDAMKAYRPENLLGYPDLLDKVLSWQKLFL